MNHAVGAWSAKKTPLLGNPVWQTFDEVFSKLLGCEYTLTDRKSTRLNSSHT